MKKIIYSIVTALMISVILACIFPTWFLRENAQWTYLNDTARVDIYLVGKLKNGRVKVEGTDLRVTYPKVSNTGFQGVVVEFPVFYRAKSYQLKLTPQADEWGNDAAFIIKFLSKDFKYEGKREPAWVCFRNITLNGQSAAEKKVVCHDTSFVLKYPPHSSPECTLTFDICKSFATSDISFRNLLAAFFSCSLLCLFFAPLKRGVDHVLTFINERDAVQVLSDGYQKIDPVYRRSFWIIFGILCFAFGFHAIQFLWGNHDWYFLKCKHLWLGSNVREGRYMIYSVKVLLSQGVYLPFVYDLITFVTLAINAVLLCHYWRLKKRVIYFVLCGLVLTVQPFTLDMMFFAHMLPEVFIGVTCVLVALLLSESTGAPGGSIVQKAVYSFIAVILINFSLATYPVLINTIAVTFAGRLLVLSFDWDGSWRTSKSYIRPFIVSTTHIILGVALYKLIVALVFPVHDKLYNVATLSWDQVPERLEALFRQSMRQLYEYNLPFFSQWILWVFLGLTLILIYCICRSGNFKQKIVRLSLLYGSLFATQTAMIIAKNHIVGGRIELFGLVFFEVLVMSLVLSQIKKLHNLSVIAGACIIFVSIIDDLDCLRVWKLGFDAEKMQWNRVLTRLEIQRGFDPRKKYQLIQIGQNVPMRQHYYTRRWGEFSENAILRLPFDPAFSAFCAHQFYYPVEFLSAKFSSRHRNNPYYEAQLKRLYQAGVLQNAEVWPRPNGLIVWKDIILYVTDGKELAKYKRQFEQEKK